MKPFCQRHFSFSILLTCFTTLVCLSPATAQDWTRFLGKQGRATIADADVPLQWNDEANLKWKAPLPGPGSSSPIVLGDRVYLTCYTGYGTQKVVDLKTSDKSAGDIKDLTRHLLCYDRESGKQLWQKAIGNETVKNEDPYKSYITYHGYATNTPITDGKMIYVFFGKVGIIAFDLDGNEKWRQSFEGEPNETRWGSAASPIFFEDDLIVNAIDECGKILAIKKSDGSIRWEFETGSRMAYSTPALVKTASGSMELVVAIPEKVYGVDPKTGQGLWHAKTTLQHEVNPAIVVAGDIAYIYGGYQGVGSLAIRSGGKGDVSQSHVLWATKDTSYVSTPILKDQHLYWIDEKGIAYCVSAESGKRIYRERVPGTDGGRGVKFFASPVLVGDNIIAASRSTGTYVWKTNSEKFELVSHNKFEADESVFNGTPAVSGSDIFMRSNKFLYCVSK